RERRTRCTGRLTRTWLVPRGAEDEHEPQGSPRLILERKHHHGGPEARAVLANPPTLDFQASLPRREEIALGISGRTGVGRVKAGDVFVNFHVETTSLRTKRPADDTARGVEEVDGASCHGVSERPRIASRMTQPQTGFGTTIVLACSLPSSAFAKRCG